MVIKINGITYSVENISTITLNIDSNKCQWNDFKIFGIKPISNIDKNGVITIENYNSTNDICEIVYSDYSINKNDISFKVDYAQLK